MKAIRVHQPGGPEVLQLEDLPTPEPGTGQVLINVEAAGINYADVGLRRGMMGGPHGAELPFTPGYEAVGTVAALGPGVEGPPIGARVAAALDGGGYAEYAVAPAEKVWRIPDTLDAAAATALLIQGLTAYGLIHDAARVQPGEWVLITAAAGGVGSLGVQLARLAGARVIGAASGGKLDQVRALGAEVAIDYTQPDWTQQVFAATGGRGADVALESVGGAVGEGALRSLAPLGRLVIFGGASGQPIPLQQMLMMPIMVKGLTISGFGGPWLRPGRAQAAMEALTRYVAEGQMRLTVGQTFPLAEAAAAHRAIEARQTTGKIVLLV